MTWTTNPITSTTNPTTTGNCVHLVPAEPTASLQPVKPRGRPFKPGQSGNPKGRPKGSRNRLTDSVLRGIADDFAKHGQEVLERVRKEEPTTYLKLIVKLLPATLVMQFEQHRPGELAEQVYKNEPPQINTRTICRRVPQPVGRAGGIDLRNDWSAEEVF
jgi:hypothetical protein